MRSLTVLLWVLAGLCLVVAVRSRHRVATGSADRIEAAPRRKPAPVDDPREAGRVGPCWDDAARELLHVGDDRWLGVGCDVEGAQRWGESPECTLLRKRITACLRRDRQPWVLPPTDYARPRKLYYHGGKDCGGHPEPVERWTDGPII